MYWIIAGSVLGALGAWGGKRMMDNKSMSRMINSRMKKAGNLVSDMKDKVANVISG